MCTNLFQINIVSKLHVFSVNLQNLQSASGIRDADVHLSVKTTWIKARSCQYSAAQHDQYRAYVVHITKSNNVLHSV